MKKIPIDVSSFAVLRKENYIYVDKTKEIHNLVTGGRFYFLSRPRRFGKSLFISTLKELFAGNDELFSNLWIGQKNIYDWPKHPVIHLDFSLLPTNGGQYLEASLNWLLQKMANDVGLDVASAPSPGLKLLALVEFLAKKNSVVILIDEYDYPLINNITNQAVAEENLLVLRNFYSVIKGLDAYLRAIFITGVTNYAKTFLFSGLNNLNDLTFDPRGSTILGYTQNEISHFFEDSLAQLANQEQSTVEETLHKIKLWYDNYRFSEQLNFVHNPFSVLYCLQKQKFSNYWFESGTPQFLVHLLKKHRYELYDINEIELSSTALGPFDVGEIPLIPILFQAGYLTICDYRKVVENEHETEFYKLKFPNIEVAESFKKYLLAAYMDGTYREADILINDLKNALRSNDIASFCTKLQSLLAHIPYQNHIHQEAYYHSQFQLIATLLGIDAQSEVSTSTGIIDMVINTADYIYVIEIKFDAKPDKALKQIEDKKYYERYRITSKKIVLVGLAVLRDKSHIKIEYKTKEVS